MEPQPTDLENAMFCVFVGFLAKTILEDFASSSTLRDNRMSISRLDDNFVQSQKEDAVLKPKLDIPNTDSKGSVDDIVNGPVSFSDCSAFCTRSDSLLLRLLKRLGKLH